MDEWETVDAAEQQPAEQQTAVAEAEPSSCGADAPAEFLWRRLVTDRRYSGTIQMIQNKLREDKSPNDTLRKSFVAAATDYILPDKIPRQALAARACVMEIDEWAAVLRPVLKRLSEPEKDKGGGGKAKPERSAAELASLEQGKSALLLAICCVFSPDSFDDLKAQPDQPLELAAVPASFEVSVCGDATLPFASELLVDLVQAGQGGIDNITCSYDLRKANRQRAERQERAKASARARQLHGRGAAAAEEPPAAATVLCKFTLRGTDPSALLQAGKYATKFLRDQAKRGLEDEQAQDGLRKKRHIG